MTRGAYALFGALVLLAPTPVLAGPVEDAHRALDGWSAAYTAGDAEAVVKAYWPDALLFGTAFGDLAKGTEAIRKHYVLIKATGEQNRVGARHTVPLGPNAVLVTGHYEFIRLKDGKPVSAFARFTMLFTKHGAKWGIAYHHSSPYVEGAQQ